jgi:hypothetical protein
VELAARAAQAVPVHLELRAAVRAQAVQAAPVTAPRVVALAVRPVLQQLVATAELP